jgi:hypothetical protein
MSYREILEACLQELRSMGKDKEANKIRHAVNMYELKSCLREYVCFTDAKVNDFIQLAKNKTAILK